MLPHPGEEIAVTIEAFAVRKEHRETGRGALAEVLEKILGTLVEVANDRQIERILRLRQAIGRQVARRVVTHEADSSEVQLWKLSERDDGVVWVGVTRLGVHGLEQCEKLAFGLRSHRRQDEKRRLRGHELSGNSKLKLMSFFLLQ